MILHHILVKWKTGPGQPEKTQLFAGANALFAGVTELPGVYAAHCQPNVTDRPNRYDLMIVLTMEQAALPGYDASELHRAWKEQYGGYIENKAIFDCEA